MGRITASVTIANATEKDNSLRCDALVDTGASHMVLPMAWKERLGKMESTNAVQIETATQDVFDAEICGPVRIQIEGFRAIYSEVAFVEMQPKNGDYEPLIGYLVLEQTPAAVDIVGHRLIPVPYFDLK